MLPDKQKIEEAMQTLKDAGYCVDNLWHINDVLDFYSTTVEKAQKVLYKVFTNEHVIEYINNDVASEADKMWLTEKVVR